MVRRAEPEEERAERGAGHAGPEAPVRTRAGSRLRTGLGLVLGDCGLPASVPPLQLALPPVHCRDTGRAAPVRERPFLWGISRTEGHGSGEQTQDHECKT